MSFVGLGPGDPALRSARAVARLAEADVVVRPEDGLSTARLAELAREGKRVAVAVGGDVLESAQALGELRALAAAGVTVEVVPAVGAASAAAAFAGIVASAVRVAPAEVLQAVSGHREDAVVSLVADPGTPTQRVLVTTVGRAHGEAQRVGGEAILVVFGAPEPALRWFERRPLFGKRVLVTRAEGQASGTAALLREHGAEPRVVPTIVLGPPSDPAPLARALADLRAGLYAWVAFTSANGVARTWEALTAGGGDARAFGRARLAAIGPATARALEAHGLRPDVVAQEFRGEGLAASMLAAMRGPGRGELRVLLARAAKARDVLPEALREAGCLVDVVAAYETRPPPAETVDALRAELESGRLDAVTFTSSSTVEHLCDLVGPRAAELLSRTRVASIGPITTDTARARGIRVDVTAAEYTVPGLVEALAKSWALRGRGPATSHDP
ncbi:MAG: uroporphyrinogen-III synthase [Myxococcales bacterium]|nr:uroporphyrinogen-III synthase [Myxococcales bacterium]